MSTPARLTWWDLVLGLGLAGLGGGEIATPYAFDVAGSSGPTPWHVVVAAVTGFALTWRRRSPVAVALFVTAVLALQAQLLSPPNVYVEIVIWGVAVYALFAHSASLRDCALPATWVSVAAVAQGSADPDDPVGATVSQLLLLVALLAIAVGVRHQRTRADRLAAERDAAQAETKAVAEEERVRIARELHDVVAHGMSVVVLQARAGRKILTEDPAAARRSFDDIERVASECLDEMRRLLGILRDAENGATPLAPQPKLAEIDALVARASTSGADVRLETVGTPRELPPAVELTCYRIAQEALTNTIKHAPGSRVRVLLTYEADAVSVEVSDDGPGATNPGRGHGLIGMRERVDLFGGTFLVDSPSGGGFTVRARLPLSSPATLVGA